jgi:hypothetical protein
MMLPCEGSYASVKELAEAIRDDRNTMDELRMNNSDRVAERMNAAADAYELVSNWSLLETELSKELAQRLWDEHPHIYRVAAFELKERIAA